MRVGILEIAIVITVVVVIALVAGTGGRAQGGSQRRPVSSSGSRKVKLAGAIVFLLGLLLLSAAVSLFRYLVWSYMWASLMLLIGLALYLFGRRR